MAATDTRKKILFVVTKSNLGGAQRYLYDLATSLPQDAFEVSVAFGGNGPLKQKLEAAHISTYTIKSFERDIHLSKELKSMFELADIIRTLRPDIIHLNSSKAGGSGAFVARLLGVPKVVFTAHGWPFLEQRNILWRMMAWIFSWITSLLSHAVIVVSDHDLKIARRMPFIGKKSTRIYNGIAPMTFGTGEVIRSAFPQGVTITGMIGELNHNKNQIALIEQAKNNQAMYLALVGTGEDHDMLTAEIRNSGLQDRAKLFGFIPANEALKGFDVFALSSRKEGLPYVLLEARAAGLPIEANRVGGVGEILDAKDMNEFTLSEMVRKTTLLYKN